MSAQAMVGVLAGLGLVLVLVGLGARAGRRVERISRRVGRMRVTGYRGQMVAAAVVIAAVQWAVITWMPHPVAVVAVFGVSGLLAGATVARLVAVAELVRAPQRGSRR